MDNNQELLIGQETSNELDVKIVKLNFHSLYEFHSIIINETKLIAKGFPIEMGANFEREKLVLERLNHHRIIKPLNINLSLVNKLTNNFQKDILVFPEVPKQDAFTFIKKLGGLSEKAGCYYLHQIIDSLIYSQQQNSLHPNLTIENILLTEDNNILLCGWSNSRGIKYNNIQDYFFRLGQIIIFFIISRNPISVSDLRFDPWGKFLLKEQTVGKFWQQLQKSVKHVKLSQQLKDLINNLFLRRISTFHQILDRRIIQNLITAEQLAEQLVQKEIAYKKRVEERTGRMTKQRIQEKSLLDSNGNIIQELKYQRSDGYFLQQYENYHETLIEIPLIPNSVKDSSFKLYDPSPKILITHLRARLKQIQANEQEFGLPLLLLNHFDVSINQNIIDVKCVLLWNHQKFIEKLEPQCGFHLLISISLFKDGDSLFGTIPFSECSELSSDCVYNVNQWIREILQFYG